MRRWPEEPAREATDKEAPGEPVEEETTPPPSEVRGWPGRVEQIMGMPIAIDARDPDIAPGAIARAFAWLRWVDATFSPYRADSAITRLNRREVALADAPSEVRAVLARCVDLCAETEGYFDVRVAVGPGERRDDAVLALGAVDPSGLVKGWAVDRAASPLMAPAGLHRVAQALHVLLALASLALLTGHVYLVALNPTTRHSLQGCCTGACAGRGPGTTTPPGSRRWGAGIRWLTP